jgi:ABC-type branched-subunit amino acid transport system ATPase component
LARPIRAVSHPSRKERNRKKPLVVEAISPFSEAVDLRRNFNNLEAITGINFVIQSGEIYWLLGLNRAGKTTTILLLTGQIDPVRDRQLSQAATWLRIASV